MKRRTIFAKALANATGKPEKEVKKMLRQMQKRRPEALRGFDEDVPEAEAQELIAELRKEGPGILQWLAEGSDRVHARGTKTRQ